MNNLYRRPSINTSYQVLGHLAMRIQRRRIKKNWPIRNKNCFWWPCLFTDREEMCNLYKGPSRDAPYQASDYMVKRFQRRFFRNRPIRNKNCLWQPCLLTDRDKMNNLYRGHFIDASYPVSFLFGQVVAEKIFRNWPIRNKNCLLRLGLLTDLDKMSNLYRGLSIDASYQVSVHLAKWFQRRFFLEINQSETRIVCGGHVC